MEIMFARGRYTYIRVLGFPVLYGKREEGFKREIWYEMSKRKLQKTLRDYRSSFSQMFWCKIQGKYP